MFILFIITNLNDQNLLETFNCRRQKLLVPSVRDKVRKQTKYAKGAATALLASASKCAMNKITSY